MLKQPLSIKAMNRKYYAFVILTSLLMCSCITIDQVTIDYMKPSQISLPAQIKTVVVVNNTVTNKGRNSIEKKIDRDGRAVIESRFQGDGRITADELSKNIAAQNYFDQVLICDSALREKDHFPRKQELTKEEVTTLSNELGADMLISVEDVTISTKHRTERYPNLFHSTIDATVEPVVRLYIPNRSKAFVSIQPKDSIFWESYGTTDTQAERELIKKENQVKEASQFAGELPAKYILPTWDKALRFYYINGAFELKDAAILVREKSWDKASALWLESYSNKNEKVKFRSAFNLAVYYELNDSIDKAIEWLEKAELLINKKKNNELDQYIVKEYSQTLQVRKGEIQTLNIQMSRFKDNF